MIIFIDESGDPGLKNKKDSSPFLVISLLIFENDEDSTEVARVIEEYRKRIKHSPSYEFKFRKTKRKIIIGLLKSIQSERFKIRAIVLDKSQTKLSRDVYKKDLYHALIALALEGCLKNNLRCKVRLDGIADREFRNSWRKYLRENLKRREIDFKLVDSKSDSLIQLADLVAGSIRRSHLYGKNDANIYKKIIQNNIEAEIILEKSDLEPILK